MIIKHLGFKATVAGLGLDSCNEIFVCMLYAGGLTHKYAPVNVYFHMKHSSDSDTEVPWSETIVLSSTCLSLYIPGLGAHIEE